MSSANKSESEFSKTFGFLFGIDFQLNLLVLGSGIKSGFRWETASGIEFQIKSGTLFAAGCRTEVVYKIDVGRQLERPIAHQTRFRVYENICDNVNDHVWEFDVWAQVSEQIRNSICDWMQIRGSIADRIHDQN